MNKNYKRWQDTDVSFIKDNYNTLTDKIMSETLSKISGENITVAMVRRQRRKLKLCRKRGRPKKHE